MQTDTDTSKHRPTSIDVDKNIGINKDVDTAIGRSYGTQIHTMIRIYIQI